MNKRTSRLLITLVLIVTIAGVAWALDRSTQNRTTISESTAETTLIVNATGAGSIAEFQTSGSAHWTINNSGNLVAAGAETVDGKDVSAMVTTTDIDTFSEIQAIVADKTLINEEDEITFDVFPITPSAAPDANYEVSNKKYVDDTVAAAGGADMDTTVYDIDVDSDIDLGAGGTGASLADPGADRLWFWDDGVNAIAFMTAGTNISISGTALNVDDAFLANDGDVGTGTYNFGGADDLEIPNGAAVVVDTDGQIAIDTDTDGDYIDDGWLVYYSTSKMYVPAIDAVPTVDNNVLTYDADNDKLIWQSSTAAAAGSDTQVMYNSSGTMSGDAGMTYAAGTDILTLNGGLWILESAGATFYTKFAAGDQAANVSYTLPTDDGDNGQYLTTDGGGVLGWGTPAGAGDMLAASYNEFSEVQALVADKTLVNEEDAITLDTDLTVTGTVIATVGFDTTGAADMDYGSADVTDHTFVSDGGTVIIDGGIAPSGTSFPGSPTAGSLFYHTTHDMTFQYENSVWNPLFNYGSTLALYVDGGAGSDAIGKGFGSGADATATIQYCWDKCVPKFFAGTITINVAAGTYSEDVTLLGKTPANSTAFITIVGTLTNSTSGTATSGSITTLVHAAVGWGVNDHQYKLLRITSGTNSGQSAWIRSNTADTITVGGRFTSACDATSVYSIDTCGTTIGTGTGKAIQIIGQKNLIIEDIKTAVDVSGYTYGIYIDGYSDVVGNRIHFGVVDQSVYMQDNSIAHFTSCYVDDSSAGVQLNRYCFGRLTRSYVRSCSSRGVYAAYNSYAYVEHTMLDSCGDGIEIGVMSIGNFSGAYAYSNTVGVDTVTKSLGLAVTSQITNSGNGTDAQADASSTNT